MASSLLTGLKGYWRFNEALWAGVADEVIDSSGEGNHGIAVNGLTTIAGGKLGRCTDPVASSSQYVDCASPPEITSGLGAFSLAAWIKGPFIDNQPLIGFRATSTNPSIILNNTLSRSLLQLGTSNFRRFSFIPVDINDGNWHLVIYTVPGSGQFDIDSSMMYADDQAQNVFHTFNSSIQTGKTHFQIARAFSLFLDKHIDEVAVWNRVLTAVERTYLYNLGLGAIIPTLIELGNFGLISRPRFAKPLGVKGAFSNGI